jgi:hypothetical protein
MKLKATKSFHASGIGTVHQGAEFETHDALGTELSDKGLAVKTGDSDPSAPLSEKAELPPLNKADFAPKTKRKTAPETPPEPIQE